MNIIILDPDEASRQLIAKALKTVQMPLRCQATAEPALCLRAAKSSQPSIIIANLDASAEHVFQIGTKIQESEAKVGIIALTESQSANLLLQGLKAGIDEFVLKPVRPRDLAAAIARVCKKRGIRADNLSGQVIAVFSGKGGCGCSTLACNLAILLGRASAGSCCLVDADTQFGDAATLLDLQPKTSLADAAAEGGHLDAALLSGLMVRHPAGISLLAAPREIEEAEAVTPQATADVLSLCRSMFAHTVFDLPHEINDNTLAVLDEADKILLVGEMLVPSVRHLQRCLALFDRLEYPRERIHPIITFVERRSDLTVQDIQEAVERAIFATIPRDDAAVAAAANEGVPVVLAKRKTALAAALDALCQKLIGKEEQKAAKRGILGKLFRKKAKPVTEKAPVAQGA